MIDRRLIDYSMEYADYKESLGEEAKSFTLDDVMIVLEGFLAEHPQKTVNPENSIAVIHLKRAHNTYMNI
ncbi:MAG: hypothetical protein O6499_03175 [Candidatus Dadabacteria bacterium]|nr:hypothetical protein [Candidatus Dadabacteria bacterium]